MPGSLLEGYLRAQAHAREQETLADQKKAQKLEEALNQLRLKQLGQSMAQAAEEWNYQKRKRAELDEAVARLQAGGGTELDYALAGLKAPREAKEEEPWFIGTPHEERYLRKETYIKPEAEEVEREPSAAALKTAMDALYPRSEQFRQMGEPLTAADSLWGGLITKPRIPAEEPFFAGKARLGSILGGPTLDLTAQKKAEIDRGRAEGYTDAEIKQAVDAERDRLVAEGIDIDELYRYLGY